MPRNTYPAGTTILLPMVLLIAMLAGLLAVDAHAGGSNYGITPGVPQQFSGKVREWPVPTPLFARDPAVAPDGSIFIAVMTGNKVARFDPKSQTFTEWNMPRGHHPHGLLVDRHGTVWTTGNGNGTIGKLKPASRMSTEFTVPSGGGGPHTVIITDNGETLWFTMQSGNKIGSLDTATGRIVEYPTAGGPYGIALDRAGNVWWCRMADDKLGMLNPATGVISELDMGRDSRPRRMATAPDGTLWVTLYGKGALAKVDPAAMKVLNTYALPGGNAGAYAVTVDGAGTVWVNQINIDTVIRFDPGTEKMQVIKLPTENTGIRKMVVDGSGRLWYMGSHSGKLGVIE